MRLWKKRDAARDLVIEHAASVRAALQSFESATRAYFVDGNLERAAEFALEAHCAEGKADDIRRSVEKAMISGALFPPLRRQILDVVERTDALANAAEASLDSLLVQRVKIPDSIALLILQILDETMAGFDEVEAAIRALFAGDAAETLKCVDRIEEVESRIDHIERESQKKLFAMSIDLAEKLHVAGYIADLVKISDRAEDLSDRIALIVAERAY